MSADLLTRLANAEALLARLGVAPSDIVTALETLNKLDAPAPLDVHDAACLISVEPS